MIPSLGEVADEAGRWAIPLILVVLTYTLLALARMGLYRIYAFIGWIAGFFRRRMSN